MTTTGLTDQRLGGPALSGQNVVLFGGASGIGSAVAADLVARGATVEVFDRLRPAEPLQDVFYREVDVRSRDRVNASIEDAVARLGSIHGLVYAVGVLDGYASLRETDEVLLDLVLDINVKGAIRVAQAVAPHMQTAGYGRMVFFGSIAGSVAGAGGLPYTASKHALLGVVRALALELASDGITVNAIAPGSVAGTNIKTGISELVTEELQTQRGMASIFGQPAEALHPVGRVGTVDAIAPSVAHLLAPSSWFITGTTLTIDGGYTVR